MAFPSTEPIAYYKLDESSGNPVDSKNSYDLTNNGTTPYATGLISNCADFGTSNSTKSLSRTGNPATTVNGGNFTISYWGKVVSGATYQCKVEIQCTTNGAWFRAYVGLDAQNNRWLAGWHGGNQIASGQTFSTSTWYHVVITNNGGTLEMFGNGVSKGTTAVHYGGSLSATDNFSIGNTNAIGYGDGYIDEVGVWDSVLSGTEITDLYNGGAGVTYPTASAAVYRRKALLGVGQ